MLSSRLVLCNNGVGWVLCNDGVGWVLCNDGVGYGRYAPLVSAGSYMIVEDSSNNGIGP